MIEFKIRPDKRGKWRRKGGFFRVILARDRRAVQKMYGTDSDGVVAFIRANQHGPDLGFIVFPSKFGDNILSHEAAHAALYFISWQQTGKTFDKKAIVFDSDEQICLAVGNIAAEITKGLYRKGVWK
jgi:selenocysteine lyase/cysteine desulfurase